MAINDIVQTIAEARVDARSLSDFVFKPAGFKVARRLAPPVDTLQFYINRFNSLNGDFRSSVSVALSSLDNSIAEAEGKVAYIETTVQDAINNTAVEGGVLADTFVTVTANGPGTVERTQRDKNADVISVKDYGAKGDGITNDSAAFELLETNVTGRRIDLQGKTYAIDAISRYNNTYYNGYFKVGSSTITANGDFKLYGVKATPLINIKRDGQVAASQEMYRLTKGGLSLNNVVQSFAVDEVNGYIYTHHVTDNSGEVYDVSIINRYKRDVYGINTYIDYCNPTKDIGHQGLSVQYMDSGVKFWASSPYANAGGRGDSAVRFSYKKSADGDIDDVETFQLFPTNLGGNSTSPTVSYCGNYLIARHYSNVNGVETDYVRVFNIHEMDVAGDYSNKHISEFQVAVKHGTGENSYQSMVCDGAYIYIMAGNADINVTKTIGVYSMIGEKITHFEKFEVGKSAAAGLGSGTVYEPEGMCIATTNGVPKILVQFAMDDGGARKCRVFALGENQPLTKYIQGSAKPSFISKNGSIDYAVPVNESQSFGTYDGLTGDKFTTLFIRDTGDVTATGKLIGKGVESSEVITASKGINSSGGIKVGTGVTSYCGIYKAEGESSDTTWRIKDDNKSLAHNMTQMLTLTSTTSAFSFAKWYSGGVNNTAYGDAVYEFTGDGNGKTDGTWTGGGADYAEYFEWADGNINNEDRRGMLVSISHDSFIKVADVGDEVIGVISGNPAVIGNSAWNMHEQKYLRDKYNTQLLDDDGYKIPNPDYDESLVYIPREDRQEWDLVGLLGKVVVNEGQNVPDRWVRLGMTSDDTCEYLVR